MRLLDWQTWAIPTIWPQKGARMSAFVKYWVTLPRQYVAQASLIPQNRHWHCLVESVSELWTDGLLLRLLFYVKDSGIVICLCLLDYRVMNDHLLKSRLVLLDPSYCEACNYLFKCGDVPVNSCLSNYSRVIHKLLLVITSRWPARLTCSQPSCIQCLPSICILHSCCLLNSYCFDAQHCAQVHPNMGLYNSNSEDDCRHMQ